MKKTEEKVAAVTTQRTQDLAELQATRARQKARLAAEKQARLQEEQHIIQQWTENAQRMEQAEKDRAAQARAEALKNQEFLKKQIEEHKRRHQALKIEDTEYVRQRELQLAEEEAQLQVNAPPSSACLPACLPSFLPSCPPSLPLPIESIDHFCVVFGLLCMIVAIRRRSDRRLFEHEESHYTPQTGQCWRRIPPLILALALLLAADTRLECRRWRVSRRTAISCLRYKCATPAHRQPNPYPLETLFSSVFLACLLVALCTAHPLLDIDAK